MKCVLTIAGSDCSGGAGIQADLKTIGAYRMYGMSVVTAITVQNTLGVKQVEPLSAELVGEQLQAVLEDICPDAIKIGMVATRENILAIASVLKRFFRCRERNPFVVLDPVLLSTSGRELLEQSAREVLERELFPLVNLLTPNIPEAAQLCGEDITGRDTRERAAKELSSKVQGSLLIKGGHDESAADDLLYEADGDTFIWYQGERIYSRNNHGTGCTLSSAIACEVAAGKSLSEAVQGAKNYLTELLKNDMNLGKGNGPLNHFCVNP